MTDTDDYCIVDKPGKSDESIKIRQVSDTNIEVEVNNPPDHNYASANLTGQSANTTNNEAGSNDKTPDESAISQPTPINDETGLRNNSRGHNETPNESDTNTGQDNTTGHHELVGNLVGQPDNTTNNETNNSTGHDEIPEIPELDANLTTNTTTNNETNNYTGHNEIPEIPNELGVNLIANNEANNSTGRDEIPNELVAKLKNETNHEISTIVHNNETGKDSKHNETSNESDNKNETNPETGTNVHNNNETGKDSKRNETLNGSDNKNETNPEASTNVHNNEAGKDLKHSEQIPLSSSNTSLTNPVVKIEATDPNQFSNAKGSNNLEQIPFLPSNTSLTNPVVKIETTDPNQFSNAKGSNNLEQIPFPPSNTSLTNPVVKIETTDPNQFSNAKGSNNLEQIPLSPSNTSLTNSVVKIETTDPNQFSNTKGPNNNLKKGQIPLSTSNNNNTLLTHPDPNQFSNTKGSNNLKRGQITLSTSNNNSTLLKYPNVKFEATDPNQFTNTKGSNNLNKQPIRQRKKTSKHRQESSSSSNNNDRTTDIYYPDENRTSQTSRIKYIVLIIISIFTLLLYLAQPFFTKPSLFQKFADTTNNIFKELNNVELPDVNTVMEHSVACRRAAIAFQRSPAFKSYGSDIAAGLRDFGETTKETGHLLREMYSKSSSIFTSFDIEIEAMMHRLNSNSRQGDARYFKERLNRLLMKIKDLRQLIEKARNRILNVEEIRHQNEGNVENGLREAEKYGNNENYSGDIIKAKKELAIVNEILVQLHLTADKLEKLGIILKYYEDKLGDVLEGLDNVDGSVFKITKTDLKYLEHVIDNSKSSYNKFDKLQISD